MVVKATSHKLSQQVVSDRALISRFAQEIVRSRSVFFTSVSSPCCVGLMDGSRCAWCVFRLRLNNSGSQPVGWI
jgi:hypothetical protein